MERRLQFALRHNPNLNAGKIPGAKSNEESNKKRMKLIANFCIKSKKKESVCWNTQQRPYTPKNERFVFSLGFFLFFPFERSWMKKKKLKLCPYISNFFLIALCCRKERTRPKHFELTVCITETRYCRCSCNYVYFIHIICTRHTNCTLCVQSNGTEEERRERPESAGEQREYTKLQTAKVHICVCVCVCVSSPLAVYTKIALSYYLHNNIPQRGSNIYILFILTFRCLFSFFLSFFSSVLFGVSGIPSCVHTHPLHCMQFTFHQIFGWIKCQAQGINEKKKTLRGIWFLSQNVYTLHNFTLFALFFIIVIRFMLIFLLFSKLL